MQVLGLDIGGSGIKAAVINTATSSFVTERVRVATPQPATVAAVRESVRAVLAQTGFRGPVGCGFPGIVRDGVIHLAANLAPDWLGTDWRAELEQLTGHPAAVLNDADVAGLAEVRHGAGAGVPGTVLLLTVGTGIGSALFTDGRLVPNTEFGHLEFRRSTAEKLLAEPARLARGLTWKQWARRFNAYLEYLRFLFSPALFIVGGGGAKKADKFLPHLTVGTPVVAAKYLNKAGILGAALAGAEAFAAAGRPAGPSAPPAE